MHPTNQELLSRLETIRHQQKALSLEWQRIAPALESSRDELRLEQIEAEQSTLAREAAKLREQLR